jgi:hypothetical protein
MHLPNIYFVSSLVLHGPKLYIGGVTGGRSTTLGDNSNAMQYWPTASTSLITRTRSCKSERWSGWRTKSSGLVMKRSATANLSRCILFGRKRKAFYFQEPSFYQPVWRRVVEARDLPRNLSSFRQGPSRTSKSLGTRRWRPYWPRAIGIGHATSTLPHNHAISFTAPWILVYVFWHWDELFSHKYRLSASPEKSQKGGWGWLFVLPLHDSATVGILAMGSSVRSWHPCGTFWKFSWKTERLRRIYKLGQAYARFISIISIHSLHITQPFVST